MFAHEKLQVYGKALGFAAKAAVWTSAWDKKHALVDHLSRATESILVNLAEAARRRGTPSRLRIVDYAIGSALECAGCLDNWMRPGPAWCSTLLKAMAVMRNWITIAFCR